MNVKEIRTVNFFLTDLTIIIFHISNTIQSPCQVKDLHRCNESGVMEEDESDTSFSSKMGVMVIYELEGQQLTSEEDTKDEDDQTSRDRGNA